jgi:hypothetical protein
VDWTLPQSWSGAACGFYLTAAAESLVDLFDLTAAAETLADLTLSQPRSLLRIDLTAAAEPLADLTLPQPRILLRI